MKYDYDERTIKNALNSIQTPEYDIVSEVEKRIRKKGPAWGFKRYVSVGLAVCLCLILSIGAMAATIPGFKNLLPIVGSDFMLLLQPIEIACEDNGIKMEVLGAMNDDEMAVIYITMKDLVGDRIDETLDIYNYRLTGTHIATCQMVHFDKTTRTATLRMQANGGKKLNGRKMRFQVDSFLSNLLEFDNVETGINLSDVKKAGDLQTIPLDTKAGFSGGGCGGLFEKLQSQGEIRILTPDQKQIILPQIDFAYISNVGFVDGRLHVQTKWVGDGIDDHGDIYLVDSTGNAICTDVANIYFGIDKSGRSKYGRDYVEYIFDISNLDLGDLKLMGNFVSHGNYITGNWKATFKIQSVGEELQVGCSIKYDTLNIKNIKVSPLGITLMGHGEFNKSMTVPISVKMADGSIKEMGPGICYSDSGKIRLKYMSTLPLDISKIESVVIGGTDVNFN
ncbi:MAG: DUF4179 domain-containing protein [Natronincolaceae bacterium]|jgi:hypothetical protein|nr:DUF4179 domain-containing protein [Bacillota bacterium]NLK90269.1 DUF4179 domain-containing protein [Clostridiales bacterium]